MHATTRKIEAATETNGVMQRGRNARASTPFRDVKHVFHLDH
jgi:hypothetical protein